MTKLSVLVSGTISVMCRCSLVPAGQGKYAYDRGNVLGGGGPIPITLKGQQIKGVIKSSGKNQCTVTADPYWEFTLSYAPSEGRPELTSTFTSKEEQDTWTYSVAFRRDARAAEDAQDRLTIKVNDHPRIVANGTTDNDFKDFEDLMPFKRALLIQILPQLQGQGVGHNKCAELFRRRLYYDREEKHGDGLGWLQGFHIRKREELMRRMEQQQVLV
ncbi:hypothetical protein FOZ63_000468 [Perkinsus olseni]|uniref:Uncharacterized protein n=1 Tax=Perkinsus olseni TaxID=32597 RepID=A0A7J6SLU9_PEROL|nr:hypothetical protein FOZ63_000468 [Perkinsus olseni]KAF4743857.1 hypothetical protein FOZ62_005928 [Perkinsus olseni]